MTYRAGDADDTVAYLRSLEDRIKKLEAFARISDKTSTKELKLTSGRKFDSLLVVGDSISQFDRLNRLDDDSKFRQNPNGVHQARWQDQLADRLALPSKVTRFVPTVNPPADWQDYTTEGTGSFRHWDFSCIGATAEWMSDAFLNGVYVPPPVAVDLYVIFLGINDWSTDPQVSPDNYFAAMQQLITERSVDYNNLVLIKPWQWDRPIVGDAKWSEYTAKIDILGEMFDAPVVDLVDGIVGRDLAPDGVHASQQGHNLIYSKVWDAVKGLSKKPSGEALLSATSAGVTIGGDSGALVIGNWKIEGVESGEGAGTLVATNLLSGISTTIA